MRDKACYSCSHRLELGVYLYSLKQSFALHSNIKSENESVCKHTGSSKKDSRTTYQRGFFDVAEVDVALSATLSKCFGLGTIFRGRDSFSEAHFTRWLFELTKG